MKIRYEFANGEVSVVEVEEQFGEVIMDSRRKEHALNEKERYHTCPLDALDFEGEYLANNRTPEDELDAEIRNRKIVDAFNRLTPTQQRRIFMLAEGMSIREIAKAEEADYSSVRESLEAAKKKFIKFFSKNTPSK